MKILAINPGSTSTKISVFEDLKELFTKTLRHSNEELAQYPKIMSQYDFRKKVIIDAIKEQGLSLTDIDVVVGRGGLVKPIKGGVYKVNDALIKDLHAELMGEHASNLGGILAKEIAKEIGENINAFIVDPVVVDEMDDIARISGMKDIPRVSIFHALNQKAVARRFARENNKKYNELNLIVVHLGGGISVGAHKQGKVVDVNNALDGDGPFSPERSGGVPIGALVKMCFSGKYTLNDIKKKIKGEGGLVSYLNTNDARIVEDKVKEGNKEYEFIYQAMAYQISKEIGALSTVLFGKVDAIILTGGLAYDKLFCQWIKERVNHLGNVFVYPGEGEMESLTEGAFFAMKGELEIQEYK